MSLFSSFIIDPVVRHARRFSGQQATEASNDGAPSLACDNADASSSTPPHGTPPLESDAHRSTQQLQNAPQSAATDRPTLTVPFRRHSALTQSPRSAVVDEEDEEHDAVLSAKATTAPINIPTEMSSQSPNVIARRMEQLDISSPASSAPSASAIPEPRPPLSQHASAMSETLPADDGMAPLRMRIHQIRDLKVTDEERARMIHGLMTERYNIMRPTSPNSFVSHDRPFTPTSGESVFSEIHVSSPYSSASDVDPENPYNLRSGDTDPTYRPNAQHNGADHADDEDDDATEEDAILGCQHYKRNVKVQCFQCRRWYTCRHCHDAVEDHHLNRKLTQNMLCMACGTPQEAAEHCKVCETQAACYYCDICKLWDNNSKKKIYHCPDCGICRRGEGLGKDFYHCKVRLSRVLTPSPLIPSELQRLYSHFACYIPQVSSTCAGL